MEAVIKLLKCWLLEMTKHKRIKETSPDQDSKNSRILHFQFTLHSGVGARVKHLSSSKGVFNMPVVDVEGLDLS